MSATRASNGQLAERLAGPAMLTVLMLALLIGLGVWQLHRLAWKEAILARIGAAEQAPPIPLAAGAPDFTRVSLTGTLRPQTASYGDQVNDTPQGPRMGSQTLRLLDRPGETPVLVDLGWVPEGTSLPDPAGPLTVIGYLRPVDHPTWLSAVDNPAARRFYTLDPVSIGASLGSAVVAPFTLVAMGKDQPGIYPQPAEALPQPINNHLSYALTWFGLAVVLVVIFGLHAGTVIRKR